jgi:carbon monoxide dehydrogenase subunit G
MTRIESDTRTVNQSPEAVFKFLSDFNNFKQLMPEQVTDWVSDSTSCSFNIKGMASLGMAHDQLTPNSEIRIKRSGKAPFDFFLICSIDPEGETQSRVALLFDADLNPFLKMMAEKPLTNFLNMLVNKFADLCDSGLRPV